MSWRLILMLGIGWGLPLGIGGFLHWPAWIGYPTALAAVCFSVWAASRTGLWSFANGFCIGAVIALLQNGVALLFWPQFAIRNARFVAYATKHLDTDPHSFLLTFVLPCCIIAYGLLIGVLSYFVSLARERGKRASQGRRVEVVKATQA